MEQGIEEFWAADPATAGLREATRKTQLTRLPYYLQPRLAREISYVWAALSSACHYHPYDLAPTGAELAGWIDTVVALLAAIKGDDGQPDLPKASISDLGAVVSAIGGAAVTVLFNPRQGDLFGWYSIGLVAGLAAFFLCHLAVNGRERTQQIMGLRTVNVSESSNRPGLTDEPKHSVGPQA